MSGIMTPLVLGRLIRAHREAKGLSQKDLGMAANAGARFIGELESGKETCQIGKALRVAASLGITLVAQCPHLGPPVPLDSSLGDAGGYDLPEF